MSTATTRPSFYTGEFRHGIDPKNRVTIPSAWRSGAAECFHVSVNTSGSSLLVFSPEEFRKVIDDVKALPNISPRERQQFIQQFAAGAMECSADKQGRMVLPVELCNRIGLQGEAVLVGAFSRFEIWNPEQWAATKAAAAPTYQDVANQLGL